MTIRSFAFLSLLIVVCLVADVGAIPPPMTVEKIEESSDFVGTVRVLGVVCSGESPVATGTGTVLNYQAWLQVVEVKKGTVKTNETILVQWHTLPKGLIGGWSVPYHPGEEVPTALKWNADKKAFDTTWYNAKGKPAKKADSDKLPEKVGEVMMAK